MTIELFTTIPANEMIPIPVMITTKGMRKIIKPNSTPMVDNSTDVMIMNGLITELNWLTRISAITITAVINAPRRNSCASC